MVGEVEAFLDLGVGGAQADEDTGEEPKADRSRRRPSRHRQHGDELHFRLAAHARHAGAKARAAQGGGREHGHQQRAQDAAHAMNGEDVQGVIDTEAVLDQVYRPEARSLRHNDQTCSCVPVARRQIHPR